MFHKHQFKESKDPNIIWCTCGESRDIHQHIWEKQGSISEVGTQIRRGLVLKCTICGSFKEFKVKDY